MVEARPPGAIYAPDALSPSSWTRHPPSALPEQGTSAFDFSCASVLGAADEPTEGAIREPIRRWLRDQRMAAPRAANTAVAVGRGCCRHSADRDRGSRVGC